MIKIFCERLKTDLKNFGAGKLILLLITAYFVVGFIIYPLYSLVKESVTSNDQITLAFYSEILKPSYLEAAFNSVFLSLITVAGSCLIGVYLAYVVQFHKLILKSFLSTILLLPIATPPIVGVTAFLFLLGENGLLNKIVSAVSGVESLFDFDGWTAIIIIHLFSFYPLFYLFAAAALQKLDQNLIDASHSMGASVSRTFVRVIFPQLIPAVIGASLLTFMASMASFSAPFIFGGSSRFLTTEIYNAKINGDNSLAAALSVVLTLISTAFLFLLRWYRSKNVYETRTKGASRVFQSENLAKHNWLSILFITIFSLFITLPILSLVYLALMPEGFLMKDELSAAFTLENFANLFSEPKVSEPFVNSLEMSIAAVVICLIIGIAAAILITKEKIAGSRFLETFISLPYGIPGTVIALSLIVSFNAPVFLTGYNILIGTFWILPIAYAVRNLPILTQSAIAGLQSIDPSLEEASSSLGASALRTFRKITLPLLYPSVLHGALLMFINSFGEFVSTILLYTYSTRTISVEIYSQLRIYNNGIAAAYGVVLFSIVMLVVFASRRTLNKAVTIN